MLALSYKKRKLSMKNIFSLLTENEIATRKQWLTFFLCNYIYGLAYSIIVSYPVFKKLYLDLVESQSSYLYKAFFPIVGGTLALSTLFFFIQYRCIYKKPGTKWLTFFIIVTPLSLAALAYSYFTSPSAHHFPVMDAISSLLSMIGFLFHLRMRRINKRLQSCCLSF